MVLNRTKIFFCLCKFAATSSVLKYLNTHSVHDHIALNTNVLNASALLPCNSFNKKTSALLSSPSTNAYTNFMYANWIDLHAKMPDQTKYLFCLQGNFVAFFLSLSTHSNSNHKMH